MNCYGYLKLYLNCWLNGMQICDGLAFTTNVHRRTKLVPCTYVSDTEAILTISNFFDADKRS